MTAIPECICIFFSKEIIYLFMRRVVHVSVSLCIINITHASIRTIIRIFVYVLYMNDQFVNDVLTKERIYL